MSTIKNLNDQTLLSSLKILVQDEKKIVAEVLRYLLEVEQRRLHLARGYSSMFNFCMEYLGYSEGEAHIRIQAARLAGAVPGLSEQIEDGQITLSVAAMAQSAFRKQNLKRKEAGLQIITRQEKINVVEQLQNCSQREAEKTLAITFGDLPGGKKLSFEADEELLGQLEELKGLLAHKNFAGDLSKLIKIMAAITIEQIRKNKPNQRPAAMAEVAAGGKAKRASDAAALGQVKDHAQRSRYIPPHLKRMVWKRDRGECTFVDPLTRRQCRTRHGLEVDHIIEFARGGSHEMENLRLLCSNHNKFRNFRHV